LVFTYGAGRKLTEDLREHHSFECAFTRPHTCCAQEEEYSAAGKQTVERPTENVGVDCTSAATNPQRHGRTAPCRYGTRAARCHRSSRKPFAPAVLGNGTTYGTGYHKVTAPPARGAVASNSQSRQPEEPAPPRKLPPRSAVHRRSVRNYCEHKEYQHPPEIARGERLV